MRFFLPVHFISGAQTEYPSFRSSSIALAPILMCAFAGFVIMYVLSVFLGNGDRRTACAALSEDDGGEGLCQAFVVFIRHGEKVPPRPAESK